MPALSEISIYSADNTLSTGNVIQASEHNTHRNNVRTLFQNELSYLADLEVNFASASEPTDTDNGKFWYDSGNTVWKGRRGGTWVQMVDVSLAQTMVNKTIVLGTTANGNWSTSYALLEVGGNGALWANKSAAAGGFLYLTQNAYNDGTNTKYISTDEASNYYQQNGTHNFQVAASGTAGTNVTWKNALTIDSSGNTGLGDTSPGSALTVGSVGRLLNIEANDVALVLTSTNAAGDTFSIRSSYDGSGGFLGIYHENSSSEMFRLTDNGVFSFGGDAAPDADAGGITLNHGANDGFAFTIKNSDVAHGITGIAETDTYITIGKNDSSAGGILLQGLSSASIGIQNRSYATTEDTTDTSGSTANFEVRSFLKSGTSVTDHQSTANIFGIRNNATGVLLLKGSGELHITNTTLAALDNKPDIILARNTQLAITKKHKHLVSKDDFQQLIDLGVLSAGGEFQILQGVNSVSLGAISQLFNGLVNVCVDKLGMTQEEVIGLTQKYV